MKQAALWEKSKAGDGAVACFLCAHRCKIAPGARGICGVRENRGGTLYTLTYGRLISRAVDPIEKKPLYHFLPGTPSYSIATAGCNLRCDFCQNWQISQLRANGDEAELPGEDATPAEVAEDAARSACASVAYTYTEPTIFFEFARDTCIEAHRRGIANVFVTNGFMTPETVEAMTGLVDAANVNLKSMSDDFYRKHCKARLGPVLESIKAMHAAGMHVEATTLVIPGRNDGDEELRSLAEFLAGVSTNIVWHVSRFHPDFHATDLDLTPADTLARAVELGREAGLRYVFTGNISGGPSDTLCPACGATVIARRGFRSETRKLRPAGDGRAHCADCGFGLPVVTRFPAPAGG